MNDPYEYLYIVKLRKVRFRKPFYSLFGLRSRDTLQGFYSIRNQSVKIRRRLFGPSAILSFKRTCHKVAVNLPPPRMLTRRGERKIISRRLEPSPQNRDSMAALRRAQSEQLQTLSEAPLRLFETQTSGGSGG